MLVILPIQQSRNDIIAALFSTGNMKAEIRILSSSEKSTLLYKLNKENNLLEYSIHYFVKLLEYWFLNCRAGSYMALN